MINVLVVHGTFGKPFENWFPWLEKELSKSEIACVVPQFPTPDRQSYANWEELLNYYVSIGVINKDTFFIGHSSGATFLVKYLLNNAMKIRGLITVSGFNQFVSGIDAFDALNADFYFDPNKDALMACTNNIHCFMSDNDPYLPSDVLDAFSDSIGGKVHLISGAGHFNSDSGYSEFPAVTDILGTV